MTERLLRLKHIVGSQKDGIEPMLPISRAGWYAGVKAGKFPAPIKLGPRTALWRESDVLALLDSIGVRHDHH